MNWSRLENLKRVNRHTEKKCLPVDANGRSCKGLLSLNVVVIQIWSDCRSISLSICRSNNRSVFITFTALWCCKRDVKSWRWWWILSLRNSLALNHCSFAVEHLIAFQRSMLETVIRYFIDLRRHLTNNEFRIWNWCLRSTMETFFVELKTQFLRAMIFTIFEFPQNSEFDWINR